MQQYVPIQSYYSYLTANLVLTKLQDEHISCHLLNEHTMLADPLLGNAIGGIQLMVHHAQLTRAIEIMKMFNQ